MQNRQRKKLRELSQRKEKLKRGLEGARITTWLVSLKTRRKKHNQERERRKEKKPQRKKKGKKR